MRDESAINRRQHWDAVHKGRCPDELSWYTLNPAGSLAMIDRLAPPISAAILDIGGGVSHLADEMLVRGHTDVSVLDISADALAVSRQRIMADRRNEGAGKRVRWIDTDVLSWKPSRHYDVWHDRALFHFLNEPADRARYRDVLRRALAPAGHAIIGTFAPGGPEACSGLPVARYDVEALTDEFRDTLTVVDHGADEHLTPAGARQPFTWIIGELAG